MSEVSKTVLVNKRKSFEGAFTDPDMVMYLPVNKEGHVCCALEADYLEAWVPQLDLFQSEIPRALTREDTAIIHALLARSDDDVFGMFATSVAFRGIKVMNEWLHHLQRAKQHDLRDIIVYHTS